MKQIIEENIKKYFLCDKDCDCRYCKVYDFCYSLPEHTNCIDVISRYIDIYGDDLERTPPGEDCRVFIKEENNMKQVIISGRDISLVLTALEYYVYHTEKGDARCSHLNFSSVYDLINEIKTKVGE